MSFLVTTKASFRRPVVTATENKIELIVSRLPVRAVSGVEPLLLSSQPAIPTEMVQLSAGDTSPTHVLLCIIPLNHN